MYDINNNSPGVQSTGIPKLNPYVAISALLTMMIPTDVVTLKLHAAKSRAAFLSDFFRVLISAFTASTQRSLDYTLPETDGTGSRNPKLELQIVAR